MRTFGSVDEILDFAINAEIEAYKFYIKLSDFVESPEMAEVLSDLASVELEHKAKLELELMKIGKVVDTESKVEKYDSSDYVYSDATELDMDYMDVLSLAAAKEDAAFRLYVDLVPQASDEESREMLLALAQEEARHKLRFETERDRLLEQK